MNEKFFNKIDSKEKAYTLGFLLGDGYITKSGNVVTTQLAIKDKEIVKLFAVWTGGDYTEDQRTIKEQRKFPSAKFTFRSKEANKQLQMLFGGRLKKQRRAPRIKIDLEPYFLKGFFDAEGCITWGYRKDRDRLWQKVSYTSSESILKSVQPILASHDITTSLTPKGDEDCYQIEYANEYDVYLTYKLLPKDIGLNRKITHFEEWLNATKEKYTFNKRDQVKFIVKRTSQKYNLDVPYAKGTWEILHLDKTHATIEFKKIKLYNIPLIALTKQGMSNMALRLELG